VADAHRNGARRAGVAASNAVMALMTNLRSGCVGLIPAPDLLDIPVEILKRFASFMAEDRRRAEELHRGVLPWITFVLQSLAIMLCYGKRLFARRIGITTIHDRGPALAPSAFGLSEMEALTAELPEWPS
jgi:4-hydroxy-tetrahydrodipicolinate synthase